MRKTRIISILALILILALVGGCGQQQAAEEEQPAQAEQEEQPAAEETEEVTLVDWGFPGDIQDMFRQNQAEPFMEEHPNVTVELLGGITEDAVAQIKAAQGASPIDTILLGEPRYLQAEREGWILELTEENVPNIQHVYPNVQEKCEPLAVAWTMQVVGLAYNPELVPEPKSWEDLWKPEYEGMVGMASPSSNAGFLFMMLVGKQFGESESDTEAIWQKLDELQPFVVASNPETLGQLLEREEIGVAINWSTEAAVTMDNFEAVEFTLPEPGGVSTVSCYGVLKDTEHPELAAEYVNVALGEDFQKAMSEPPWFFAPVNQNVEISAESQEVMPAPEEYENLITIDWEAALELREDLTDEFTRRYGQ